MITFRLHYDVYEMSILDTHKISVARDDFKHNSGVWTEVDDRIINNHKYTVGYKFDMKNQEDIGTILHILRRNGMDAAQLDLNDYSTGVIDIYRHKSVGIELEPSNINFEDLSKRIHYLVCEHTPLDDLKRVYGVFIISCEVIAQTSLVFPKSELIAVKDTEHAEDNDLNDIWAVEHVHGNNFNEAQPLLFSNFESAEAFAREQVWIIARKHTSSNNNSSVTINKIENKEHIIQGYSITKISRSTDVMAETTEALYIKKCNRQYDVNNR